MATFDRPLEDPLVEKLLVAALLRINSEVKTVGQAKLAIATLRKTMSHPDKLTANRQTLDLLRDGTKVVLTPGEDARTIRFIAFDPPRQGLNDFTATNQYRVQGVKQCRDDTVLLVNGIPLVVAEYKSYCRQQQGLAGGSASAPPLPTGSAADADAKLVLHRGRRGRVPLRHRPVP